MLGFQMNKSTLQTLALLLNLLVTSCVVPASAYLLPLNSLSVDQSLPMTRWVTQDEQHYGQQDQEREFYLQQQLYQQHLKQKQEHRHQHQDLPYEHELEGDVGLRVQDDPSQRKMEYQILDKLLSTRSDEDRNTLPELSPKAYSHPSSFNQFNSDTFPLVLPESSRILSSGDIKKMKEEDNLVRTYVDKETNYYDSFDNKKDNDENLFNKYSNGELGQLENERFEILLTNAFQKSKANDNVEDDYFWAQYKPNIIASETFEEEPNFFPSDNIPRIVENFEGFDATNKYAGALDSSKKYAAAREVDSVHGPSYFRITMPEALSTEGNLPAYINSPTSEVGNSTLGGGVVTSHINPDDYHEALKNRLLEYFNFNLKPLLDVPRNDNFEQETVFDTLGDLYMKSSEKIEDAITNENEEIQAELEALSKQSTMVENGISFLISNFTSLNDLTASLNWGGSPIEVKILTNPNDTMLTSVLIATILATQGTTIKIVPNLSQDTLSKMKTLNRSNSSDDNSFMMKLMVDLLLNSINPSNLTQPKHFIASNNNPLHAKPNFAQTAELVSDIDKISIPSNSAQDSDTPIRSPHIFHKLPSVSRTENFGAYELHKLDSKNKMLENFESSTLDKLHLKNKILEQLNETKETESVVQKEEDKWDWQSWLKKPIKLHELGDAHQMVRGRRSRRDSSVHADDCHSLNLKACGQPALKKLMKETDMKTRCSIREEFLSCMLERRFLPCLNAAESPGGHHGATTADPKLKELRSKLKKHLATNCLQGYSSQPDGGDATAEGGGPFHLGSI